MAEVLGRVVPAELDSARGPDASHRIRVPREWLELGSVVELELPRHLTCRACEGGGCDACDRSGAVTLRGRDEPPDIVEVTLPSRPDDESFVIRIPEQGGLAREASGLPRGQLFLRVEPSEGSDPSASVTRVPEGIVTGRRPLDRVEALPRDSRRFVALGVAAVVAIVTVLWIWFSG